MTAPINPHVHTHSRNIAAEGTPPNTQRQDAAKGAADPDDTTQPDASQAVSVDVRGAVGAENRAAAASAPQHLEAASELVTQLGLQITADPQSARSAHANVRGQAAYKLLS